MPRVCTICSHPDKDAIDRAIVNGQVHRKIASLYSLSPSSILKHKASHLPDSLLKAKAAEEMTRADTLLLHLTDLYREATELSQAAKRAGDIRAGFLGIRERKGLLDLLLELAGRLDRKPTLKLAVHPEWILIRTTLISALSPYPEAASAVAEKLVTLESPQGAGQVNGTSDQSH